MIGYQWGFKFNEDENPFIIIYIFIKDKIYGKFIL